MSEMGHLSDLLNRMSLQRILVIGDLMLDRFIRGSATRISPESPVAVVDVEVTTEHLGGAANVAHNVCPFAEKVGILGVIGIDGAGNHLEALLADNNITDDYLIRDEGHITSLKTRVIAGSQQVVRFDHESVSPVSTSNEKKILEHLSESVGDYDCVIVADYAKGLLMSPLIVKQLRQLVEESILVLVDPHVGNLVKWRGMSVMKPNYTEACRFAGLPILYGVSDDERLLQEQQLLATLGKKWGAQHLLITLGSRGMLYAGINGNRYAESTIAREAFDVSGAGDTVSALFALAISAGADCEDAVRIANCAAGIVVEKLGTMTVSPEELIRRMEETA